MLATRPTVTNPGDFITLRAEMDCIVALSACPQDIVKIQGRGQPAEPFTIPFSTDGFPKSAGTMPGCRRRQTINHVADGLALTRRTLGPPD